MQPHCSYFRAAGCLKTVTQATSRASDTLQRYPPLEGVLTTSVRDLVSLSLHSAKVGSRLGCRGLGLSCIGQDFKCPSFPIASLTLPPTCGSAPSSWDPARLCKAEVHLCSSWAWESRFVTSSQRCHDDQSSIESPSSGR